MAHVRIAFTLCLFCTTSLFCTATGTLLRAADPAPGPSAFETPEAAWKDFTDALSSGDWATVEALLGSASSFIPKGARGSARLKLMAAELSKGPVQVDVRGGQASFVVGGRPFPLGARKTERGWVFGNEGKDGETAGRGIKIEQCTSQLKRIAAALAKYEAREGKPAPSLEALMQIPQPAADGKAEDSQPERANDEKPAPEGEKRAEAPAAAPLLPTGVLLCPVRNRSKHRIGLDGVPCDYIYVPVRAAAPSAEKAGGKDAQPNLIVAFCPQGNHGDATRTCAFADGHVELAADEAQFRSALKASLAAAGVSLESLSERPRRGKTQGAAGDPNSVTQNAPWRGVIVKELGMKPEPPKDEKQGEAKKKTDNAKK